MQTERIVEQLLQSCGQFMHAGRVRALRDVCQAAVLGSALSLSVLACGLGRRTTLRHRVKCVDRLLGNAHLGQERAAVYRSLAASWLSDLPQLLIVVDWSSLSADQQWHWLRAAVVVQGRSVTLYEEVHPRKQVGNRGVHRRFLARLAQMLPPTARAPIVLTDAGFRTTWFQLLAECGWYWVGRIRNRDYVRPATQQEWFAAKTLYRKANARARDLGAYEAVRSNPIACRCVLIKKPPRGRKRRYASGREQRNGQARKVARAQREPWLLTCAPGLAHLSAQAIVSLYAQRMQIEQQFRDTKNLALGMGLSQSRTRVGQRLQVLLLIAHIAELTKRLIGEAAKAQQMQLQLMCTNRTDRAEISVMTLAKRVIARTALLRGLRVPWQRGAQHLREQVNRTMHHAL